MTSGRFPKTRDTSPTTRSAPPAASWREVRATPAARQRATSSWACIGLPSISLRTALSAVGCRCTSFLQAGRSGPRGHMLSLERRSTVLMFRGIVFTVRSPPVLRLSGCGEEDRPSAVGQGSLQGSGERHAVLPRRWGRGPPGPFPRRAFTRIAQKIGLSTSGGGEGEQVHVSVMRFPSSSFR